MNNLLENLNEQQKDAVLHGAGPLLIVAGAGTGKTTVITRRIANLILSGQAKPNEIAALTFTEKAAGEMQERVDLLMPLGSYDSWICTFHGFCERLLKAHALDIGLPNDFTLMDGTQQWIMMYKNIRRFDLDYYRPLGNPGKFIDALLSHFSRCKDELISPEDYLEYAESLRLQGNREQAVGNRKKIRKTKEIEQSPIDETEVSRLTEIANAYHMYQHLLLEKNALDFGDLITYTVKLLLKRPKILAYYQDKFKFIMVDEFQDTNLAQYELVKLLSGKHKNLTVVGDDDQSIYKFRGASVSNILKLKHDYPDSKEITLIENYRSTQNILDLAYEFIQNNNPDRLEVKLEINKRLKSNGKETGVIQVLEGDDLQSELNCVADKIVELQTKSGDSWNDFVILLRRNASAEELLPVLSARNIPHTFFANKGLYKKQIIVDLVSYLKLMDNAHDSKSLYRVLTLPAFNVPHEEMATLLLQAHKKAASLFSIFQDLPMIADVKPETRNTIHKLLAVIKKHSELAKKLSASELFVHLVKDLGLELKIQEETIENMENRELIEQFYKKIEAFQQQEADKSMHNYLATLQLEMEAGNEGEIKFDPNVGPESLKVMTVHASKGLEFKYVFVISMVDQRFPTREKSESIEIPDALVKDILPEGDFHLQEERRLFYVAITRAKSQIYLSWAKDYGGSRSKKPSVFLTETNLVPSDIVSKATGKVVFTVPPKKDPVFTILPTQFSYSQINDFENCPLKYKYQHYLKLPVEGSGHLSFGQTVHKVMEEYLKAYKHSLELPAQDLFGAKPEGEIPPFSYLEKLYEKHWVDDWYKTTEDKEDFRKRGKKMLHTFYDSISKTPLTPKYIEQFFKLHLGPFTFVGKIDRADKTDGGITILDYKTGKIPKAKDKKDIDQLYIYQWAAEEFLHEKVIGLTYWYLHDNEQKMEEVAKPEDIDKLKQKLLEAMERIVYTTKHDLFLEEHKKVREHNCEFENLS